MNTFDMARFIRIFTNDLFLLKAPRVAMATLAVMGLGLLTYYTNAQEPGLADAPMSNVLFPILLLGGGLIFTSIIYGDMHHPLERFHYLTLPCSNLERFLSRYLITAPLYYVYALAVYFVFELIAKTLFWLLFEVTFVPFEPFNENNRNFTIGYFGVHAVVYTGAIYFRSYALIKTCASYFALSAMIGLVFFVTLRILFWDNFISLFRLAPEAYINMETRFIFMEGGPTLVHKLGLTAFLLWVLFLGYMGLRDHEVQDGL